MANVVVRFRDRSGKWVSVKYKPVTILLILTFTVLCKRSVSQSAISCYDKETGKAQRCMPEFMNPAFRQNVEVTNTCGIRNRQEFCRQIPSETRDLEIPCEFCDNSVRELSHPPEYLTDLEPKGIETWWQSETMYHGVRDEYQQVNLTLRLGKAFDITYIRLKFQSPRPESFAIYKKTKDDGPWIPYQYYSSSCRSTYNTPSITSIRKGDEARALCSKDYSDISPLSGGSVAFGTLENRPSAYEFENSPQLQEWVTATHIRIVLDRMNTFGDELFGDDKVLKSYYYAISEFAVGGRCKCNGHASECIKSSIDGSSSFQCICEHYTAGSDCNECLPFYNDLEWRRATAQDAYECQACNCSGRSNQCYFDRQLYERTGHGGHCLNCIGNTDGPHCEHCQENFYPRGDGYCAPCQCDETGSRSLQCNDQGICPCKQGIGGDKCDICQPEYFGFSEFGCIPCGCNLDGSEGGKSHCDSQSGKCRCKMNVEGKQCQICKPGYFNLDSEDDLGCTPCFCYGHSSICSSATGFSKAYIESYFIRNSEKWFAEEYDFSSQQFITKPVLYDALTKSISISSEQAPIYYLAPSDQRASYNHFLSFTLRIGETSAKGQADDIQIVGANGLILKSAIFLQQNPLPSTLNSEYKFRLHEAYWNPTLNSHDFMSVLTNISKIKIRGTYGYYGGSSYLSNVKLETAKHGALGNPAKWIEICSCPKGYVGQFCESCEPGYRHEIANGGPFSRCIECNCNNHANICDIESGRCICEHNTAGNNCEFCAKGFYGNALQGTVNDCKTCPCPEGGACIELENEIFCTECPLGYTGPRCNLCVDGYFGDPAGRFGPASICQPCECNSNIDPNAVGNCNGTTGECLKCIYNTGGFHCQNCLPGYYGDALSAQKDNCKPCNCNAQGSVLSSVTSTLFTCDQLTGQCQCKPHVAGRQCDECVLGYFGLDTGEGCHFCNCDPIGSFNFTCNQYTGKCYCREGIVDRECKYCIENYYGFSFDGCKNCNCDPVGSLSLQCDETGQCLCRENVEGQQCDRCKENKYNRQQGCLDCPPCYNLVQEAIDRHRHNLTQLEILINAIDSQSGLSNDLDFENKLKNAQTEVDNLLESAKMIANASTSEKSLQEQLKELQKRLMDLQSSLKNIRNLNLEAKSIIQVAEDIINQAEGKISKTKEALRNTELFLDTEGKDAIDKAKQRAQQSGQQSDHMSEIARDARQMADEHEKAADNIEKMSEEALNVSAHAYNLTYATVNRLREKSQEINNIDRETTQLEEHLIQLQVASNNTQKESSDAYEEALSLITEIKSLSLPDYDNKHIAQTSQDIRQEAENIKMESQELIKKNSALLDDIEKELNNMEKELDETMHKQQITETLLSEVGIAQSVAQNATHQGERILDEAQKMLETLQGFDRVVQDSKINYLDAKSQIPEIVELLNDAEKKTLIAENSLIYAKGNASETRNIAQLAKSLAEEASNEATRIKTEAEEALQLAEELRDKAEVLKEAVLETEKDFPKEEKALKNEELLSHQALQKADQAHANATKIKLEIQKALETVASVLDSLSNVEDISLQKLEELEKKLDMAEEEVKQSQLESKTENLRETFRHQNSLLKNFEEQLEFLRNEENNIERIRLALPEQCFRQEQLEP